MPENSRWDLIRALKG